MVSGHAEVAHLERDDQQHCCHTSKCCWCAQLDGEEDEDAGELQRAHPEKRPEGHGVIEPPHIVGHQVHDLQAARGAS